MTGEGRADHGSDADRVLVQMGLDVLRSDRVLPGLQGNVRGSTSK